MAMKQNNFYLRWQAANHAEQTAARNRLLRTAAPGAVIIGGCLLAWAVVAVHTLVLHHQTNALLDWCYDPANLTVYEQSVSDQQTSAAMRTLAGYVDNTKKLMDSYPGVTGSMLYQLQSLSGNLSLEINSYDSQSGELRFEASSPQVIDFPGYVRTLQGSGLFGSVSYSGYQVGNDEIGYRLSLRCIVAAPQEGGNA